VAGLILLPNFHDASSLTQGYVGWSLFISMVAVALSFPYLSISGWFAANHAKLGLAGVLTALLAAGPGVAALFLNLIGPANPG